MDRGLQTIEMHSLKIQKLSCLLATDRCFFNHKF